MSDAMYDEVGRSRTRNERALNATSAVGREAVAHPLARLQRAAGNAAVVQLMASHQGHDHQDDPTAQRSSVLGVVGRGGGSPLPGGVRERMESSFGSDFSDVRVHDDGAADASARDVGAHAYTVGSDVVFRSGAFDPGSDSGQRTIAHELTHVVQQRSGPVDGTPTGDGVAISDPSDRFERQAESTADQVMAGQAGASVSTAPPALQRAGTPQADESVQPMVQREGAPEEEEPVQAMVQREGAPEEEETA